MQVSKYFNFIIGHQSRRCLDRVKLVINETRSRRFTEVGPCISRCYRHLEIRALYDIQNNMDDLILDQFDSLVTIRTCYDFSLPDNLTMKNVKELFFYSLDIDKSRIEFYENGLIAAAKNLEIFTVWGYPLNPDCIVKLLSKRSELKKLTLDHGAARALFPFIDKCQKFDFHLEKFHCDHVKSAHQPIFQFNCNVSRSLMPYISYIRFVEMHQTTLRDIRLFASYEALDWILKTLKFLERLTFSPVVAGPEDGYYSFHYRFTKFQTPLKEANMIMADAKYVQVFLDNAPKLEKLYVAYLDTQMLKCIIARASNLTELRYASSNEDNHLETFKELSKCMNKSMKGDRKCKIIQI